MQPEDVRWMPNVAISIKNIFLFKCLNFTCDFVKNIYDLLIPMFEISYCRLFDVLLFLCCIFITVTLFFFKYNIIASVSCILILPLLLVATISCFPCPAPTL